VKRKFRIEADETGYADREALLELLADLEGSAFRLGGAVIFAAVQERADGFASTVAYEVQFDSLVPALERPPEVAAKVAEPDDGLPLTADELAAIEDDE
jgi:hypothetical protein